VGTSDCTDSTVRYVILVGTTSPTLFGLLLRLAHDLISAGGIMVLVFEYVDAREFGVVKCALDVMDSLVESLTTVLALLFLRLGTFARLGDA